VCLDHLIETRRLTVVSALACLPTPTRNHNLSEALGICSRNTAVSRLTDQPLQKIVVVFFSGLRLGPVLFDFAFLQGTLVCRLSYST
jgi:hypothetical protein